MRATLTVLGSGTSMGVPTIGCSCAVCHSSDPHDRRTRPSVMISYDGRRVLIDTTPDFREQALRQKITHLDAVLYTHTHADHRSGAHELSELTGAPVAMHRRAPAPHVMMHLEDGQRLIVGDFEIKVLHTPGHTPDSISLYAEGRVFTGDCLLIHGTGRADFAGGDAGAEYDSITRKLFALPDSTLVYPAHDYRGHTHSTIGEEKSSNPRVAGRSREAYVELMNNLGLPLPEGIQEALQPNQTEIEAAAIHFPTLAQLNSVRQLSPAEVAVYNAPYPEESYKAGARIFPALVPITPQHGSVVENKKAWEVLEKFEKPFLTAFSDSDPVTKGGEKMFQERVPGARGRHHVMITGARHFLQEDRPEEVTRVLDEFIRGTH